MTNSNTLAILDGAKAITLDQRKACQWPIITQNDYKAVHRVLRDGKINLHPVIKEFEEDCKKYFKVKHALAHCNGTSALLACFFALELEPGDEIIVPTATFWASVLPMLWLGLVPVFCDSEDEYGGIDPEDMRRKITSRTKAVVVVHLWGYPCKLGEINAIAKEHGLKIIEDASHAQGAKWQNKMCGSLGDVSAISMVGSKLLPAGEGGIFLTDNEKFYERAACLGDIARIAELKNEQRRFAATGFGMKTRIASLSAAIAKSQLQTLDQRNYTRNKNIEYLSKHLEELGFNPYLNKDETIKRVYFEFIVKITHGVLKIPRELFVLALQAEGCKVGLPRYPLLHNQPIFKEGHYKKIMRINDRVIPYIGAEGSFPKVEATLSSLIRLPTFPQASKKLLDQYVQAFTKVLSQQDIIAKKIATNELKIDLSKAYTNENSVLVL